MVASALDSNRATDCELLSKIELILPVFLHQNLKVTVSSDFATISSACSVWIEAISDDCLKTCVGAGQAMVKRISKVLRGIFR